MNVIEKINILKTKKNIEKITMVTAYDFPSANVLESVGVDLILVGDSLGVAVLGYKDTHSVTLAEMAHHISAVGRASKSTLIVGDLPINTYNTPEDALKNSKVLINAGCNIIKLETAILPVVKELVANNIPVMGHLGITPQTATSFKVKGKIQEEADTLIKEALELENAGCSFLVLECVSSAIAKQVVEKLSIPVIGIGAGVDCDGQVLVFNDLLGIYNGISPKFLKRYKNIFEIMQDGCKNFISEVKDGTYPSKEESYL